uniref:SET domain-containing protein n=1 Tax=Heliothis virescens TaxID=7102 RepID=A0A2A4JQL2_HELVI
MAHPIAEKIHTQLMAYLEELSQPLWMIKPSKLGGRGLFALQTIKKGTLIFKNKPLIVAPRADRAGDSYCSVCYQVSEVCRLCEQCSLAVCSEECRKSQDHVTECNFITTNWKQKPDSDIYARVLAQMQMYLRFLLLKKDHKLLLTFLQNNNAESKFVELQMLCRTHVVPDGQITFMVLVHSIININSFRIPNNPLDGKIPLRGLYPLSAFLNHSCVPNTRNVFYSDYTMAVYATKDIEVGEEILTCYTGLLLCTPARRCFLYKSKHFWCKCERCKDNTEMGTKLSALKCFNKECVGTLLPTSPLNPEADWCCDNCASRNTPDEVRTIQSILGSLVGSLDLDDQFRLEAAILARLANFIPYSNHIFIDLRLRLALKIGFTEGLKLNELSESRLALKENLCRGTLRTLAALGVGDAHLRGLLLYHLHAALAERARRLPDLYEEIKSEIESTIEQAYIILRGDISAPPDLELRHRYLGPGCDKPQEERFFILDA